MADKKTVEIHLETTLTGGRETSEFVNSLITLEKTVKSLGTSLKDGDKFFSKYRGFIWKTKNLIDSLTKSQEAFKTSLSSAKIGTAKTSSEGRLTTEQQFQKDLANLYKEAARRKGAIDKASAKKTVDTKKDIQADMDKLRKMELTKDLEHNKRLIAGMQLATKEGGKVLNKGFKDNEARRKTHFTQEAAILAKGVADHRAKEAEKMDSAARTAKASIASVREVAKEEQLTRLKTTNLSKALRASQVHKEQELLRGLEVTLKRIAKTTSTSSLKGANAAAIATYSRKLTAAHLSIEESNNKRLAAERRIQAAKQAALGVTNRQATAQKQVTAASQKTITASETLKKLNKTILGHVLGIVAGYRLVNYAINRMQQALANIPKQGIEQQANLAALVGTFGSNQAVKQMEIANKLAIGYGANIQALEKSMRKFAPSAKLAGASLQEVNQIFDDFTAVGAVLHKSGAEMESIFLALEQMFAKGTVQSEEIKKQLGNQLPAAVEIGAQAFGKTPAAFMAAMKKNEVIAKEFVPKFAKLYRAIFAGEGDIILKGLSDNLFANYQRAMTRYTDLNRAIFTQIESQLTAVVKAVANGLKVLTDNIEGIIFALRAFAGLLTLRVIVALTSYTAHTITAAIATQRSAAAIIIANESIAASYGRLTLVQATAFGTYTAGKIGTTSLALKAMKASLTGLTRAIVGISVASAAWAVAFGLVAKELFSLAGFQIRYGKEISRLTDNTEKTSIAIQHLSLDYLEASKKIAMSIQLLQAEEKTEATTKAIAEQVKVLGDLSNEYRSSAIDMGIVEDAATDTANAIAEQAGQLAKATIEAEKLNKTQEEIKDIDKKFKDATVAIAKTTKGVSQLAKEYVESAKKADELAGKALSTKHYKRLEEASDFAIRQFEKQQQASNKFMLSIQGQEVALTTYIRAAVSIFTDWMGKKWSTTTDFLGKTTKEASSGFVSYFKAFVNLLSSMSNWLVTNVINNVAIVNALIDAAKKYATSLDFTASLDVYSKNSAFYYEKLQKQNEKFNKKTKLAAKILAAGLTDIFSGIDFGIDTAAMDLSLKKMEEFLAKERAAYLKQFKNDLDHTATEEALQGTFETSVRRNKALLAANKLAYDSNLRSIEDYFTRKKALEEDAVRAEIKWEQEKLARAQTKFIGAKGTDLAAADKAVSNVKKRLAILKDKLGAVDPDNTREQINTQVKYNQTLLGTEASYLKLIGRAEEAAIVEGKILDERRKRAVTESLDGANKVAAAAEVKRIDYIIANRQEQGKLTDSIRETAIAQAKLSNFETIAAAKRSTYITSDLEDMFARTEANFDYLKSQQAIIEQARANYVEENDINGSIKRSIEAMTASLQAFALEADVVANAVRGTLTDSLSSSFKDFIMGAKSAGEAMQDFALNVLDAMAQIAANALANQIIGGVFQGLGIGTGAITPTATSGGDSTAVFGGAFGVLDRLGLLEASKGRAILGGIQPFTSGGIPDIGNKEALFSMGSLREGGKPEVILPLKRNSQGQLGVISNTPTSSGISIGTIEINVVGKEDTSAEEQAAEISNALNKQLKGLMQQQIALAGRPGGQLNRTQVTEIF